MGVGASHIHRGMPQVHSKAGVAGGAGVASSSLLKKEVPSERFNLLIEALASSTDPRLFSVAGLTLGLMHQSTITELACR